MTSATLQERKEEGKAYMSGKLIWGKDFRASSFGKEESLR